MPVVAWQGLRVRRTTIVLPEARGPRSGRVLPPSHHRPGQPPGAASSYHGMEWVAVNGPGRDAPGPEGEPRPLRLLVVGESTAAGVGVTSHDQGLAGQLATLLADQHQRAVDWAVVGQTGATLRRIRHRLLPLVPQVPGDYDLVVLLAGVNDVLGGTAPQSWAADLSAVLDGLGTRLAPEGRLVVAGVPPFIHFPSLPNLLAAYLDTRGRRLDVATRAVLAGYVEQPAPPGEDRYSFASARDLMPTGGSPAPGWFAADGFHPGPVGYAEWARGLAAAGSGPLW